MAPHKVIGLAGLGDVLIGLVLAGVGLAKDDQVLSLTGLALVLGGAGVLAWVILARNRPEAR